MAEKESELSAIDDMVDDPKPHYILRNDSRLSKCTRCWETHACRTVDGYVTIERLCAGCYRKLTAP